MDSFECKVEIFEIYYKGNGKILKVFVLGNDVKKGNRFLDWIWWRGIGKNSGDYRVNLLKKIEEIGDLRVNLGIDRFFFICIVFEYLKKISCLYLWRIFYRKI